MMGLDMRKHRPFSYLIATLIVAGVVYRYLQYPEAELNLQMTAIPEPQNIADISLQIDEDTYISTSSWSKTWKILYFGFTNCPSICPTSLAYLASEFPDLDTNALEVWFISVDPERDSMEVMKDYTSQFSPAFGVARGPRADIDLLLSSLASPAPMETEMADDTEHHHHDDDDDHKKPYDMIHSSDIYVISPESKWVGVYREQLPKGELAKEVNAIVRSSRMF